MLARGSRGIREALLGWCQLLLAGAIAWTAYMLSQFAAVLAGQSAAFHQPLVHVPDRHGALPLGACCRRRCCGARAFPLALAAAAQRGGRSRPLVGGIYAANTGGAILGALCFSLILVPWIGTQGSRAAADRARGGRARC